MNEQQRFDIISNLGQEALVHITNGNPEVIDCTEFQLVKFWLFGHECEYYFFTNPILLTQVEPDKEFTSFNQLLEEVREPHHSPTV